MFKNLKDEFSIQKVKTIGILYIVVDTHCILQNVKICMCQFISEHVQPNLILDEDRYLKMVCKKMSYSFVLFRHNLDFNAPAAGSRENEQNLEKQLRIRQFLQCSF